MANEIPELRTTMVHEDGERRDHLIHFESRGRTSHVHWDGCEVQRQFYCDHFRAAPHACGALLGFVLQVGQSFVRYLPAFDPYYDEILYCNEAKWDHVDGDKKSISNSTAVNATAENLSGPLAYSNFMSQVNTTYEWAEGGAFINASYRPLVSAYHPYPHTGWRARQFDFMDPVLTPGSKTIPWPQGLGILKRVGGGAGGPNADNIAAEVADPIMIPVTEFTIRRMFLGKIPYKTWNEFLGKVNHSAWPPPAVGVWPWTIPQFPAETLRLNSFRVTPHWSQSSYNNQWFEVEFNFSWLSFQSSPIFDDQGLSLFPQDVTWNHVFTAPRWGGVVGWYRVIKYHQDRGGIADRWGTPLYDDANFDGLFADVQPGTP